MSVPAPWCGKCHKYTRLLADDLRCPACHPLAGTTPPRAQHKPWCGRCDKSTRNRFWSGRWWRCSDCHALGDPPPEWNKYTVPAGWREGMMACDWMCYESMTLLQVGPDGLYKLVRVFFEHGWCPADIALALKQAPDGKAHITSAPTSTEAQKVARWIVNRLETWRDKDSGNPLTSPRRAREAEREALEAHQRQVRAWYAKQEARRVDPATSPGAAAARQVARSAANAARGYSRLGDAREAAARASEVDAERNRTTALDALEALIARSTPAATEGTPVEQ